MTDGANMFVPVENSYVVVVARSWIRLNESGIGLCLNLFYCDVLGENMKCKSDCVKCDSLYSVAFGKKFKKN